jgi:hypothetical protein
MTKKQEEVLRKQIVALAVEFANAILVIAEQEHARKYHTRRC